MLDPEYLVGLELGTILSFDHLMCGVIALLLDVSIITNELGIGLYDSEEIHHYRVLILIIASFLFFPVISWNSTWEIGRIGRHRAEKPDVEVMVGLGPMPPDASDFPGGIPAVEEVD